MEDIVWHEEEWPISKLKGFERNPRIITKEQYETLKKAILKLGYHHPVAAQPDGTIISGHQRVKALKELGYQKVRVTIPSRALTEEEFRQMLIQTNINNGQYDFEMLANDFDMEELIDWGMPEKWFDGSKFGDGEEPEIEEDEVPPIPENPITKLGDLWILGDHRLLCGDSTKKETVGILMDGNKADMVFTDPPYGVDYDGGHAEKGKRREKLENDGTADIYPKSLPNISSFSKDNAALYLWFSDSKSAAVTAAGYDIRNTLIWNKNVAQFGAIGAQYKSKHEPCLYCFKKGIPPFWAGPTNETSVWDIARNVKNEFHPTQKPIALSTRAINNSCPQKGGVLDLFGGSGSTLIACEETKRKCFMMELSPAYCDVIVKRWQEKTGREAVHGTTGETFNSITVKL